MQKIFEFGKGRKKRSLGLITNGRNVNGIMYAKARGFYRYFVAKISFSLRNFFFNLFFLYIFLTPLFQETLLRSNSMHWSLVLKVTARQVATNLHKFVNWMQMNRIKIRKPTRNCLRWLIANQKEKEKKERDGKQKFNAIGNVKNVFESLQLKNMNGWMCAAKNFNWTL